MGTVSCSITSTVPANSANHWVFDNSGIDCISRPLGCPAPPEPTVSAMFYPPPPRPVVSTETCSHPAAHPAWMIFEGLALRTLLSGPMQTKDRLGASSWFMDSPQNVRPTQNATCSDPPQSWWWPGSEQLLIPVVLNATRVCWYYCDSEDFLLLATFLDQKSVNTLLIIQCCPLTVTVSST